MKPIVENDISGDRDWRSIHEFLGVSPYEKPCSAMPRKIRKSRKKLVKFADDEATVREAGGDDEMNLVENMKDSQPLQTVPEASMTGSVVKKESNLEMEELDEKFEEVDAVVSAIGEMDAEAETFEDDRGNSAGDGITENKISNLDKLGENASLVSDVVGEANDMTVEIHLHAEVAAGNLNYSGENILERGKSLDTCELENVAVNNECETEDNSESDSGGVEGDVDMAGTSQGNCKNGEGIEIADAAVDDNSLKGEEKGELGYANDAGDTDDSSLHLDNTEQNSIELESSAAKNKGICFVETSKDFNDGDEDGEFQKLEFLEGNEENNSEGDDEENNSEEGDDEEDSSDGDNGEISGEEDNEDDNSDGDNEEINDEGNNKDGSNDEGDEAPSKILLDDLSDWKRQKQIEIYVGGLDKEVVEEDLIQVFGRFGELRAARILRHPTTNESKGFAFIQYATMEQTKNALSELKDGIEVKGKLVEVSVSHDKDTLFIGNISKTWTKEHVVEKLKSYGLGHIEYIHVPNDQENEGRIRGFALVEFSTHSDAMAAFQRLKKPDAVFGHTRSAKVAFSQPQMHTSLGIQTQVETVYIKGLTRSWDVKKLEEMCKQYGEIKNVKLPKKFGNWRKDFGFITFASQESALACVEGINSSQLGGERKLKAEIAKPHGGVARGGFKVEDNIGKASGLKLKDDTESVKATKANEKDQHLGGAESKRSKKDSRGPAVEKNGASSKLKSSVRPRKSVAENQDSRMSSKPKMADSKRENFPQKSSHHRMRERGNRPPKKPQGKEVHFHRDTLSRPHFRKQLVHGIHSVGQRMPYTPGYVASTMRHDSHGHAQGAISGSKRHNSDMEPHAGLLEPSRKRDRRLEPAFQHQGQLHARHPDDALRREGLVHAAYLQPALVEENLPYAGYTVPAVKRQRFHVSDYRPIRIDDYNGPGNQRRSYGEGSAGRPSYVGGSRSYSLYEHIDKLDDYRVVGRRYPSR